MPGTLYIVSTPIGNLEDMTFRALRVLKEAGVIAAEDTRHSKQLCTHFGIHTPLTSYHDFNKKEKTAVLLARLQSGTDEGFLPRKEGPRSKRIARFREDAATVILFEGPHRIERLLVSLLAGLGNRRAVLARELTKHYEEFHRGTLEELIALVRSHPPKGEITLVVEGAPKPTRSEPGEVARPDQELDGE